MFVQEDFESHKIFASSPAVSQTKSLVWVVVFIRTMFPHSDNRPHSDTKVLQSLLKVPFDLQVHLVAVCQLQVSRVLSSSSQFRIHTSSFIIVLHLPHPTSNASTWCPAPLLCALRQRLNIRPRMDKSHSKCHKLLFSRTAKLNYPAPAGLNHPKSSKRSVRGVSSANSPFLGGSSRSRFKKVHGLPEGFLALCCSVLQFVLWCVALFYRDGERGNMSERESLYCSVLQQGVAEVCCSMLQWQQERKHEWWWVSALQCTMVCLVVCCIVLQWQREKKHEWERVTALQCVAVCVAAVCCSVFCSSVLQQRVAAACCSVLQWQREKRYESESLCVAVWIAVCCSSVLQQSVAVCCSDRERGNTSQRLCVLQSGLQYAAAVCCSSVLQCVAVTKREATRVSEFVCCSVDCSTLQWQRERQHECERVT